MTTSPFGHAYLDLDADGGFSNSAMQEVTPNLYWKHKATPWEGDKTEGAKKIYEQLYTVRLPLEIAMCLRIGDTLNFIDKEDIERDMVLNYFDHYGKKYRKGHLKWKKFLVKNHLGIYIYGREVYLGLDKFTVKGFYYDQKALSEEVNILNETDKVSVNILD